MAEVKAAPPLVPHLNLSAIVEPDAEADDEAEDDDGGDDDADDDGHVDALAGGGGGGREVDVLEERHEAEGEAAALRVRRVRPLEAALGGGPVVSEEIKENSNQHFWPIDNYFD